MDALRPSPPAAEARAAAAPRPADPEPRPAPTAREAPVPGRARRVWLWGEMMLLYFVVPAVIALLIDPNGWANRALGAVGLASPLELPVRSRAVVFPALFAFTALTLTWLLLDRSFDRRRLWNWRGARGDLPRVFLLWLAGVLLTFWLAVLAMDHLRHMLPPGRDDLLFSFPRRSPLGWTIVMLAYPVLSAYLQEITHRAFWFHRYGRLFGLPTAPTPTPTPAPLGRGGWTAVAVNAVAFMWLHVVMWNWVALALTLPGGILFAWTYLRTRSTLAAGLEHALYGNWLFTVGLGWFLFTGSVGAS